MTSITNIVITSYGTAGSWNPGPDLEMIANIARYHRGAFPKKKHQNFSRLSR